MNTFQTVWNGVINLVPRKFRFGGNLQFDFQQTRVDDDIRTGSGLNIQKTHGFTALDVYRRFDINKQKTLKLGINNLLDKTYAYHVNRASVDPFNPTPVR